MKLSTLLAVAVLTATSIPALAQTANVGASANSNSGSTASANVGVQSQSGAFIYQEASILPTDTTATIKNVPAVSAPSVFGGGHPCLAGKSGGIAVAGFGGSYGEGSPEPVCMLWYMGQPEAAIRLLVMTDNGACTALGNVGYYRVGKSVIPFACGETVKGGVDTPGFVSRKTRVSTSGGAVVRPKARPQLYSKCEFTGGKILIKVNYGIDQASAIRACRSALGNPTS